MITDPTTLDLRTVVDRVRAAGHYAYVEHTGGGVLCIYAAPVSTDGPSGLFPRPTLQDAAGDARYAVIAGPGWQAGDVPLADPDDFYVGPDDDGETLPENLKGWTEERAASAIVRRCEEEAARLAAEGK
jgi:hypothetical protein